MGCAIDDSALTSPGCLASVASEVDQQSDQMRLAIAMIVVGLAACGGADVTADSAAESTVDRLPVGTPQPDIRRHTAPTDRQSGVRVAAGGIF